MPLHESKCPLLCVFYAEFDNVVGPVVCRQAPEGFMDLDIGASYTEMEQALKASFTSTSSYQSPSFSSKETTKKEKEEEKQQQGKKEGNSNSPQSTSGSNNNHNGNGLSIFDSTCEYIITGSELADKMISLCTHNMQILSRPTIISNSRYERNSLLFSVGFVLRRDCDSRPYRPVLSKLTSLLRTMEIESSYLSNLHHNHKHANLNSNSITQSNRVIGNKSRQKNQHQHPCLELQQVLRSILINLNSPNAECNLFLDEANALNLKLYNPPKPLATPVPDYVVPILLRPEWQLQMFDWDLTINWILPYIDGLKYIRLISQSPDVDMDMEMVRACLRVLKHHQVLAFVDIFKYSNIYEATPKLASIMSNASSSKNSLLSEAFDFAAKVAKKDALMTSGGNRSNSPTPRVNIASSYASQYTNSSLLAQASIGQSKPKSLPKESYMGLALSHNTPETGTIHLQNQTSELASISASASLSSSAGTGTYSPSARQHAQRQQSSLYSSSRMQAAASFPPAPDLLPTQKHVHPSTRNYHAAATISVAYMIKKEHQILKAALAQLYCSCHRNASLGEIMLSKMSGVTDSKDDTKDGASLKSGDPLDTSPKLDSSSSNDKSPNNMPPSLSASSSDHIKNVNNNSKDKSAESSPPPNKSSSSSSSPQTESHNALERNLTPEEWKRALEFFDHRRFATFGVIHGWIRRVHCFPLAYDVFHNNYPKDGNNDDTVNPDMLSSNNENGNGTVPPNNDNGTGAGTTANQNFKMAYEMASTMDGTKCDDELSCMFGMSLEKIIDLVKSTGTKDVAKIYSCSH